MRLQANTMKDFTQIIIPVVTMKVIPLEILAIYSNLPAAAGNNNNKHVFMRIT